MVVPVLIGLGIWWASTAVILALDHLPRRTFGVSMSVMTVLLIAALTGIVVERDNATVAGAYCSFTCGIVVWGWLEMSFLMGYLTGPRKHTCSPDCHGWRHFLHAITAILYHEIAIIVLGVTVFVLTGRGTNRVAAWTVAVLWAMRASAKLNLFLGVRNPGAELLPQHLAYLGRYFRTQPINWLLPISIAAGTAVATLLVRSLLLPGIPDFTATGYTLIATLVILGVLEHLLLVLPFRPTALWNWATQLRVI
jgi:putative photosynthetic complex assembly protein 2